MRWLVVLTLVALQWGCIAYNDSCTPPVDRPEEEIGFLAEDVFIDKPNARHANNAIGQLAADAFADAFSQSSAPVDFAVVNGGAVRAEGLCTTRNVLKKGPVTRGLLHEVLLFENLVMAVDLEEQEIWNMMEHSVTRLVAAPAEISAPPGGFLQVSGSVELVVDCSAAAGSRVSSIKIGATTLQRPGRAGQRFRVALPSFLLEGGDGYSMLVGPGDDPERNPARAQSHGGIDNVIASDYLQRTHRSAEMGLRVASTRISLGNCSVPPAPSGN